MSTLLARRLGGALRCAALALALLVLPGVARATQYAILICGYDRHWSDGGDAFYVDMCHVYQTLLGAGYQRANIQVLYGDGSAVDLDNDPTHDNDVTGKCQTQADVDGAFQSLQGVAQPGDVIFFFATGHGTSQNFAFPNNLGPDSGVGINNGTGDVWDYEVHGDFKAIDDACGGHVSKICLVLPCNSGGFLESAFVNWKSPDLDLAGLKQCCGFTACDYSQESYFEGIGYPLTYWWTAAVQGLDWSTGAALQPSADTNGDGRVSLDEARVYAQGKCANDPETSGQTPLSVYHDCVSGYFTDVRGASIAASRDMINWYCCPRVQSPAMWMPSDCKGLGVRVEATTTLPAPARVVDGPTLRATATLENAGNVTSPAGALSCYYRTPTLGLGFYDSGWQEAATSSVPALGAGDSLTLAPVVFSVPAVNSFGEPFWSVAARLEVPSQPAGSGWLTDDPQVKMVNEWTLTAPPEVPSEIHFQVVNPSANAAMVVLGVDASAYPSGWAYQLSPAPYDTLRFLPNEVRTATLTLQAGTTGPIYGTLQVQESLLPSTGYGACADSSCGSGTKCGGFIRVTGGCAVTLQVQRSTSVLVSLVSAQADADRVRLVWQCGDGVSQVATVYWRTQATDWVSRGTVTADGTGKITYEDREVVAGERYGYRLGLEVAGQETAQGETWIEVPGRYGLALQGLRPNPTAREMAVQFSLPDGLPSTLEVVDVVGRVMVRREVGSLGAGNHLLSLERERALPAGVYLVRLRHGGQLVLAKGTVLR